MRNILWFFVAGLSPGAALRAAISALGLMLAMGLAPAAADNPLAPLDTSSPSATFASFTSQARLIEDHARDYLADKTPAKARRLERDVGRLRNLFDLSHVPPATRVKTGAAAFGLLVDILARLPEVPAEAVPGAPGQPTDKLPAKWTVPGTEIHIVRIDSGPQAGDYLFSSDTVERLPEFHALIIDQPPLRPMLYQSWYDAQASVTGPMLPDGLTSAIPDRLKRAVLDTPLWKVLLTLLLALAVLLPTMLWATAVRRLVRDRGPVTGLLLRLTKPGLLAGLTYLAHGFLASQVILSGSFADGENIAAAVLLYASGAWAAWLACFLLVESIIAAPSIPDDSYDAHLLRLIARVGGLLCAGAIIVYGANDVGIPALGLVAGLGVGGFALALASQSTVENLFGGVSIFADKPFRVGDFIQYSGASGTVEAIGPRSSRIRGADGTLTTVPNGDLAKMHITNISLRNKCLLLHTLGLRYETSPRQIGWLLAELRRRLDAHP